MFFSPIFLSGIEQVLKLCYSIYEKSRLVKRYKKECNKLRDYVQTVEGVLQATRKAANAHEPGWPKAFETLQAALQEVERIFDDCAKDGWFKSILNADDMNMRLTGVTHRLLLALAIIPIQQANVAEHRLVAVHADVRRAHWSASKAAEQHVEQLRRLADHNAVDACISHQKLDEILALLRAFAAGNASAMSSSSSSKPVASAPPPPAAAAAGGVAGATPHAFGGVQYSQLEAEQQGLTCPISTDLFKDPVRLVQTQRTYERREIEKWLAIGGTTDPETNVQLTDFRMEPNLEMRRQVKEWLDQQRQQAVVPATAGGLAPVQPGQFLQPVVLAYD